MKRFLCRVLAFASLLLVFNLAVALLVIWPVYYRPYLEDVNLVYAYDYNAVLLADSHGESLGQDPLDGLGIINLSTGSDNYGDMYAKLTAALEARPTLDTVYITVDDHTLSEYRQIADNNERSVLVTDAATAAVAYGWSAVQFIPRRYINPYVPLFSPTHGELIRKMIAAAVRDLVDDDRGSDADDVVPWGDLSEERRIRRARNRLDTQFGGAASPELRAVLLSLLALAESNGLMVIGVRFPLAPSYLAVLGDTTFGAETVLRERGYPVLDFKYIFADDPTLFRNQDHINERGAEILGEEIRRWHASRVGRFR